MALHEYRAEVFAVGVVTAGGSGPSGDEGGVMPDQHSLGRPLGQTPPLWRVQRGPPEPPGQPSDPDDPDQRPPVQEPPPPIPIPPDPPPEPMRIRPRPH